MPGLRCPLCGEVSPVSDWTLLGSVVNQVRISRCDWDIEEDPHAEFFISHMQCPRCRKEFELPDEQQFSIPHHEVESGTYLKRLNTLIGR